MSVVNLYSDENTMWVVKAIDLGNISDWPGGIGHGFSAAGGGAYAVYTQNLRKPDWVPLNKTDFGTTDALALHANKDLNSHILLYGYSTVGNKSGYKNVGFVPQSFQPTFPNVTVAADTTFDSFCNLYLATARIDGVDRIGVISFSDVSFQQGWANFGSDNDWSDVFLSEVHFVDTENPYYGGGYSERGGGDSNKQNWGERSDFANPDPMPDETSVGALASGLISIFIPTIDQVQRLANVLWQKDFLSFMDSMFSNIEDLIISFGMVPFTVPSGGSGTYTWFDYAVLVPGATFRYATFRKPANQFVEVNLGNVSLTGGDTSDGFSTDSVLDYAPYSKLGIYLPFIGYEELNIDECRGNSINLKYRIDILSGACLALVSINGRTLYQFTGNCLVQLPITSQDCSQMISNTVNVGIAAASAGAAGAIASAGNEFAADRLMASEGSAMDIGQYNLTVAQHAGRVSNANGSLLGATANAAMGMKPNYKMSGAISGSTSLVGVKQPYLFLTTPRQSMPEGYNRVCGFPCNIGGTLGDFSGFTVVEDIRLNGLVATSPEVEEIYQLLKAGVII